MEVLESIVLIYNRAIEMLVGVVSPTTISSHDVSRLLSRRQVAHRIRNLREMG
jgi:hypothetical protein